MAINLEEHVIYNQDLKLDTVPLSVAKQAVLEATQHTEPKLDEAMGMIKQALSEMNESVNEALKDD